MIIKWKKWASLVSGVLCTNDSIIKWKGRIIRDTKFAGQLSRKLNREQYNAWFPHFINTDNQSNNATNSFEYILLRKLMHAP